MHVSVQKDQGWPAAAVKVNKKLYYLKVTVILVNEQAIERLSWWFLNRKKSKM